MVRYKIGCAALLAVCCASSAAFGACVVDDSDFTTADGGCKDQSTGLVWSPDLRAFGASSLGFSSVDGRLGNACNSWLNDIPANGGGYTDWRPVTVGEVQDALANGLNSHLDFFLDGSPDDSVHRWTGCSKKVKGAFNTYRIRFTDGNVQLVLSNGPATHVICVRGLPADTTNDCPGGPGKKKNRVGATSALSQTATGALLLLPLGLVVAARCLRPRRP